MHRRTLLRSLLPLATLISEASQAGAEEKSTGGVIWKPMIQPPKGLTKLNGFTDCVPDIVGRLGDRVDLAIFSEGNHFPALLGRDILEGFRTWVAKEPGYARTAVDNIIIVTLPQPRIVEMIEAGGITLGNLTLSVNRECGFYPDLVMGGAAPLRALRRLGVVEPTARIFARNRGPALLVRAHNPDNITGLDDLTRPDIRLVLATAGEPGARNQYFAALEALLGSNGTSRARQREVLDFPGRLGIQHRDVLQALAIGAANVGIIFRHLAEYYASAYPDLCTMIPLPGAEQFSGTIALTTVERPIRVIAARAFTKFFLDNAREVYPQFGFASMSEADYGAQLTLD